MQTRDAPAETLLIGCLISGRELALPAAQRAGVRPQHFTERHLGLVYSRLIAPGGTDATFEALAGDNSLGVMRVIDLCCRYERWRERIEAARFAKWLKGRWAGGVEEFPHLWHEQIARVYAERVVRLARARGLMAEAQAAADGDEQPTYRGGVQLIDQTE